MNDEALRANKAAMQAMAAGNMKAAQAMLVDAIALDRSDVRLWLNLAVVRRQLQDFDGAFQAPCTRRLRSITATFPRS